MAHTHMARTHHTAPSSADLAAQDAELLTTADVAALLKVSVRTLKHWRHEQRGPKYYVFNNHWIRYKRPDLIAWQERCLTKIETLRP